MRSENSNKTGDYLVQLLHILADLCTECSTGGQNRLDVARLRPLRELLESIQEVVQRRSEAFHI